MTDHEWRPGSGETKRPASTARGHRRSSVLGRGVGLLIVAVTVSTLTFAKAGSLDSVVRAAAIASVDRQNALALRLTTGQSANVRTHLKGLRADACEPLSLRLAIGQEQRGSDDWDVFVESRDKRTITRRKTLTSRRVTGRCPNAARAWTGGSVNFAREDFAPTGLGFERIDTNLSFGFDIRHSADLAIGMAFGASNGTTTADEGENRAEAALGSLAVYASFHPDEARFAEAAIGVSGLSLSDDRTAESGKIPLAVERSGLGAFAEIAIGTRQEIGDLRLRPFLETSAKMVRLDPTRQGIGNFSYAIGPQSKASFGSSMGLEAELPIRRLPDWITVTPKAGIRLGYTLYHRARTKVADAAREIGETLAPVTTAGETLKLNAGTSVQLFEDLSLNMNYETRPLAEGRPETVRMSSTWRF